MTREDIKKAFPDATEEQISGILDINSGDITKAKGSLADVQKDLTTARNTIKELEKNQTDTKALQKTIDDYKAADEKRKKDQEAADLRADHEARFGKVLGDRKFAHQYIHDGVFADFEKALGDEANKGKGDVEIFDSLTKDEKGVKPGLFENQTGGRTLPGMGNVPGGDGGYLQHKYQNNPFFEG